MRAQEPPFFMVTVGSDLFISYCRWDLNFTLEKDGRASQAAAWIFCKSLALLVRICTASEILRSASVTRALAFCKLQHSSHQYLQQTAASS